ncbi:MAG: pyrroline-5-carboxylate reductase [Chloroflexi bacterium]|nr:MAG: pyrroline-5-carboxylate reductase [Chloroflexota bacterium]
MLADTRIAFVGSGAMAEAMIAGLLNQQLVTPRNIIASGPRVERGQQLERQYGIGVTADNRAAVNGADVVVLSVKPQTLTGVLHELKQSVAPEALVLSIVAGARSETIANGLQHPAVVRSMPNTPAQIGQGITVWTASPHVSPTQRAQAQAILGACGQQVFVEEEDYLDMATAISGNGPAYVFLFMEAMVDAGVHLGFPRHIAEQLVLQTVKGSVEYVLHSPNHLARLRNQVTSPGGTSAEALYYLDKAGFRTALSRAIWAGYQRAVQLGRGKKRSQLAEDKS